MNLTLQRRIFLTQVAHVIIRTIIHSSISFKSITSNTLNKQQHSRLPGKNSWMSSRIIAVVLQAIQSIPLIPFFLRLHFFVIPQMALRVDRQPEVLAPCPSPYTEFHLVMSVVGTGVVEDCISCRKCGSYVT